MGLNRPDGGLYARNHVVGGCEDDMGRIDQRTWSGRCITSAIAPVGLVQRRQSTVVIAYMYVRSGRQQRERGTNDGQCNQATCLLQGGRRRPVHFDGDFHFIVVQPRSYVSSQNRIRTNSGSAAAERSSRTGSRPSSSSSSSSRAAAAAKKQASVCLLAWHHWWALSGKTPFYP